MWVGVLCLADQGGDDECGCIGDQAGPDVQYVGGVGHVDQVE